MTSRTYFVFSISKYLPSYRPNIADIWALGITIVIAGIFSGWNSGFSAGFGSYSIITFVTGLAYIALVFCIAEMTSALPFAGGAWGVARCTLGFYPGFIIGCCESLEYIAWAAVNFTALGSMMTDSNALQLFLWILFYIICLLIHIGGGRLFWPLNLLLGIISVLIIIIYCFGSLNSVDFNKNAVVNEQTTGADRWFVGGMMEAMRVYPIAAWPYVGIEAVAFAADSVDSPTTTISYGMVAAMITLFVLSIFVYFVAASLPPGLADLTSSTVPLSFGFFTFSSSLSEQDVSYLSMPALFAAGLGFIFLSSKVVYSMTMANLLPSILGKTYGENNDQGDKAIPVIALLVVSITGFFLCLIVHYNSDLASNEYNVGMLAAYTSYISQCYGFIVFRTKLGKLKRKFRSPFGIPGAIFAGIVFFLGLLSIIGFQNDSGFSIVSFTVLIILFSIYYLFIMKTQTLSPDEEKIMFIAHVINSNLTTSAKNRKGFLKSQEQSHKDDRDSNLFSVVFTWVQDWLPSVLFKNSRHNPITVLEKRLSAKRLPLGEHSITRNSFLHESGIPDDISIEECSLVTGIDDNQVEFSVNEIYDEALEIAKEDSILDRRQSANSQLDPSIFRLTASRTEKNRIDLFDAFLAVSVISEKRINVVTNMPNSNTDIDHQDSSIDSSFNFKQGNVFETGKSDENVEILIDKINREVCAVVINNIIKLIDI